MVGKTYIEDKVIYQSRGEFLINGKRCICVINKTRCHDFNHLKGAIVDIDGKEEKVLGVEYFAHAPPWGKGEKITLMVEG